jgi:hypothetical protein
MCMRLCDDRWVFRDIATFGPGSTILSGCMGSGTDVLAGLREGFDVVAVDISKNMFHNASKRIETFLAAEEQRSKSVLQLANATTADAFLQHGQQMAEATRKRQDAEIKSRHAFLAKHINVLDSVTENSVDLSAYVLYIRCVADVVTVYLTCCTGHVRCSSVVDCNCYVKAMPSP